MFNLVVKQSGNLLSGRVDAGPALIKAMTGASMFLQGRVKELAPVGATKAFRGSIQAPPPTQQGGMVVAEIFSDLSYALAVEYGSKPHWPPPEPIRMWVERKLGISDPKQQRSVAFLVARKISRSGTSSWAAQNGGRPGPTGGTGYAVFERTFENCLDDLNTRFFGPILGAEVVKAME